MRARDSKRETNIEAQANAPTDRGINPIKLFRVLDPELDPNTVLVADGGDFVATSAYTLRPRKPLSWLDPGVFGTLGVGLLALLAALEYRTRRAAPPQPRLAPADDNAPS